MCVCCIVLFGLATQLIGVAHPQNGEQSAYLKFINVNVNLTEKHPLS